jgi:YggT family protein
MQTLFFILSKLIEVYSWTLFIYILLSWFPNARDSSFGRILGRICEPFLEPFRRIIPPIGMMDISPIVAYFVLRGATAGIDQISRWVL